jgi:hypothetical protein
VHHAVNEKYIDKNYGSTFIIWDRMFGTFQEEEEQPIYGITKPVNSFNPVYLVFHAWGDLFHDLWHKPRAAWETMFGSPVAGRSTKALIETPVEDKAANRADNKTIKKQEPATVEV